MDSLRFITRAVRVNDFIQRQHVTVIFKVGEKILELADYDGLSEQMCMELDDFEKIIEDRSEHDPCPHCGTTELLCGHNGVGCSRSSDGI